eukprot:5118405-Pyramimonas_sp.AAC.1
MVVAEARRGQRGPLGSISGVSRGGAVAAVWVWRRRVGCARCSRSHPPCSTVRTSAPYLRGATAAPRATPKPRNTLLASRVPWVSWISMVLLWQA